MEIMLLMVLTMGLALAVGYGFMKYKVPGGLLVGTMLVFASMQVISGEIWIAPGIKDVAQIIAGCFIGASLSMKDLRRLPRLWKAFAIIIFGLIILNITIGLIIASVSNLSLVTALFASIPGGMSTIPIISADYGADPIPVTVLQFIRMVMGIGVFPSLVVNLSKKFKSDIDGHIYTDELEFIDEDSKDKPRALNALVGVGIAAVLSLIIMQFLPAFNLMVVALIIMAIINLSIGVKPLPIYYRRIAQVLSGWYVGSQFYAEQFYALGELLVPVLILIPLFLLGCLIIGFFVYRIQKLPLADSLLASIPAGASDVVLILGDLNIKNTDIVVLQVLRVIVVTSLFPEIVSLVSHLLN